MDPVARRPSRRAGGRSGRRGPRTEAARRPGRPTPLDELRRRLSDYGGDAAARKLALLARLENLRLPRARDVVELHEALCFLRAYPDSAAVLRRVERMLRRFDRRGDLGRHRQALENLGIAGTVIRFRFFSAMASWLARRWPERLSIEWREFEQRDLLEQMLPLLVHYAETPALEEYAFTVRQWLDRLRGPRLTDAAFLIRRFERMRAGPVVREVLFDHLDPPMRLEPGPDTPSRTRARYRPAPTVFQRRPLARARPALGDEIERPPRSVRALDPRQGRLLIDLAREAMVTRERDLDAFAYGDPRDVRLVNDGGGLQFACIGMLPERRLMLEAVYGFLTLKNGVPIGYVLSSALYGSAEVAYNVFETYRGAEAGPVYGRVLAMIRHLFRADAFMIPPYQLGEGNDEALSSGAWWFYRKLGFRPREASARRLMRREEARMRSDPAHRSSRATLGKLARAPVFWHLGAPRGDVLGRVELANVGLQVSRFLAARFGDDRERGARECGREAARILGAGSLARGSAGERRAWERWSPLVLMLPGVRRWGAASRRALAAVIHAKGGRRESDYVLAFDRHRPLRRALLALAEREAPE